MQGINVEIESFEIKDKTEEVINKLRKINKLFDRQRNLTKQKEILKDFKTMLKQRYGRSEDSSYHHPMSDSFKDKAQPCKKMNQRLRLCNKMHKTA